MKKTISINISGIIFHIEEDGYEKLRNYLSSIQRYFSTYEDNKEIIADIESRIAEIFLAKLNPGKQVITGEDVDKLIVTMGNISDFQAIEDEEMHTRTSQANASATTDTFASTGTSNSAGTSTATAPKKLYRDESRKLLGGVAAGVAHYLSIDPLWIRLLFLATLFDMFFLPGSLSGASFITYVILWMVIPGSLSLQEDKTIKKFYRNPDQRTIGGVASGIAAYFGIDVTIVRLVFILSLVFFGTGFLLYIILWAITPEAKTLTEKMQMQGEPVTLSNIEQNIKKNFEANENGEESTGVKLLLFPFRLIATVFGALSKLVAPIALFILSLTRVGAGLLLLVISIAIMISLFVALGMGLGWISWFEYTQMGDFPVELLHNSFPLLGFVSVFVLLLIPALFVGQLGTSLIAKRNTMKAPVGWTLFGLWIVALIASSMTVPAFAGQFRTKGYYENTRTFNTGNKTPFLTLREAGNETFHETRLQIESYEGTELKLVQRFEARGRNRQDAITNAKTIAYTVEQTDSVLTFDSNFDFNENAKFRGQELDMILYIPYEKLFVVDGSLSQIMHSYEFEGKDKIYKFVKGKGLVCQNCTDERIVRGDVETSQNGKIREFRLKDFDRLDIGNAFQVNVRQGDTYQVRVSGDKKDIEDVRAKVSDGELEIDFDRDGFFKWHNSRKKINVDIVMPSIAGLNFHGACQSNIIGFDDRNMHEDIDIQVSGAARSTVDIQAKKLIITVNSAAELELKGRTERLEAEISSAGKLRAFDLIAEEVDVDVSSSGLAEVHANQNLMAEASSAGQVRYRGDAEVNSDVSSAGSVSRE